MSLLNFHVDKRHVTNETTIVVLEITTEHAVVQAGHEKQRGRDRLERAHDAHERTEKTVEKEAEMIDNIKKTRVFNVAR